MLDDEEDNIFHLTERDQNYMHTNLFKVIFPRLFNIPQA